MKEATFFQTMKFRILTGCFLASVFLVLNFAASREPDQGSKILARGGGKTIVEGGTGSTGGFVPVITTIAFHAEHRNGAVSGAFECLAMAPSAATDTDSANFTVNAMYVTGTVKTADLTGETAVLSGTANITGLGAGRDVPFTFTVHEGGPGASAVLVTNGLTFNETLLEGRFEVHD